MFGKIFRRTRAGQVISAATLNQTAAEAERQSKLSVSGGLALWDGPGGPAIRDARPRMLFAKLTSGTAPGPYAWTEQIPASGGGWTDGFRSGTSSLFPAYNLMTGIDLDLPVVVMLRPAVGILEMRFAIGSCT